MSPCSNKYLLFHISVLLANEGGSIVQKFKVFGSEQVGKDKKVEDGSISFYITYY